MKFNLTKTEVKIAENFIQKHLKECKPEVMDCTGIRYKFIFIPSGLGMLKQIECVYCKTNQSILDPKEFETW